LFNAAQNRADLRSMKKKKRKGKRGNLVDVITLHGASTHTNRFSAASKDPKPRQRRLSNLGKSKQMGEAGPPHRHHHGLVTDFEAFSVPSRRPSASSSSARGAIAAFWNKVLPRPCLQNLVARERSPPLLPDWLVAARPRREAALQLTDQLLPPVPFPRLSSLFFLPPPPALSTLPSAPQSAASTPELHRKYFSFASLQLALH
jgi:hypothetical protein